MRTNQYMRRFLLLFIVLALALCACSEAKSDLELTQKHDYVEPPYVDYSLAALPEFVENIEACTDLEKQYVLPDGYLYGCTSVLIPYATNQLQIATDFDGAVFNGCGYQNQARIRSILEITESDYSFVTGFIPAKQGDTIYFSGNCFCPEYENAGSMNIAFYNADKETVAQVAMDEAARGFFDILSTNEAGYISSMRVSEETLPEELAYIRFTLIGSADQQIISVNEPLDEGYEDFVWNQVAEYVSASWYEEIKTTVDTVNSLNIADPANTIGFIFASDIHLDPNSTTSYTENLGKVCAEVMRSCNLPFFVTGGDNSTQSQGFMPTDFEQNMQDLLVQLAPIPQKNILLSVGNHDGATGSREYNGETVYYRFQLNNEERSAVFFDWQRESNDNKQFDDDGTYYYLDDPATKMRYIVLNSFWSQFDGYKDGFVPEIAHSFFHTPLFGSKQLKWFAEEALDMPSDYGAIIVAHFAPEAEDFHVFQGIVDAFSNQTVYEGSYVGTEEWRSTDIAVNYTDAYGEIIAVFQGHNHSDAQYDYFQKVPCINISTAGAFWAVRDDYEVERVKGTASEFAVDVVVVDRVGRKIYLTRLGAGYDRVISY